MNYLVTLLERLKSRGIKPKGFIDAGAHLGESNNMIKAVFPESRVVSFEANQNCEFALKQQGMEYFICLLGDKSIEEVPFFINQKDPVSTGCSIYKEESEFFDGQTVNLPMYRLDNIIPSDAGFDFLKMDVQGAEIDILNGATDLLPSLKYIYLEVSFISYNRGAPLFDTIFTYLTSRGYRISDICDPMWVGGKLLQCNFLFEKL
jgi:FkbM family methyltransferase